MSEVKVEGKSPWRVVIPRRLYEKITGLGRWASPDECVILAELEKSYNVKIDDDIVPGVIRVTNIIVPKQYVSGAACRVDPAWQNEFLFTHPHPENVQGVFHSHHNMGCFWSGTDLATMKRLVPSDFLLSIVFVNSGQMKARVDVSIERQKEALAGNIESLPENLRFISMLPSEFYWDDVDVDVEDVMTEEEKQNFFAQAANLIDRQLAAPKSDLTENRTDTPDHAEEKSGDAISETSEENGETEGKPYSYKGQSLSAEDILTAFDYGNFTEQQVKYITGKAVEVLEAEVASAKDAEENGWDIPDDDEDPEEERRIVGSIAKTDRPKIRVMGADDPIFGPPDEFDKIMRVGPKIIIPETRSSFQRELPDVPASAPRIRDIFFDCITCPNAVSMMNPGIRETCNLGFKTENFGGVPNTKPPCFTRHGRVMNFDPRKNN